MFCKKNIGDQPNPLQQPVENIGSRYRANVSFYKSPNKSLIYFDSKTPSLCNFYPGILFFNATAQCAQLPKILVHLRIFLSKANSVANTEDFCDVPRRFGIFQLLLQAFKI